MLSNNPAQTNASPTAAATAEESVGVMSPTSPIEAASEGGGTINDPGGMDTKPPRIGDFDHFV